MAFGDFAAENHVASNGFVTTQQADAIRQKRILDEFNLKNGELFEAAVNALMVSRLAAEDFTAAKSALLQKVPHGSAQDVLNGVDSEARRRMASGQKAAPVAPPVITPTDIDAAMKSAGKTAKDIGPLKLGGQEISAPKRK